MIEWINQFLVRAQGHSGKKIRVERGRVGRGVRHALAMAREGRHDHASRYRSMVPATSKRPRAPRKSSVAARCVLRTMPCNEPHVHRGDDAVEDARPRDRYVLGEERAPFRRKLCRGLSSLGDGTRERAAARRRELPTLKSATTLMRRPAAAFTFFSSMMTAPSRTHGAHELVWQHDAGLARSLGLVETNKHFGLQRAPDSRSC